MLVVLGLSACSPDWAGEADATATTFPAAVRSGQSADGFEAGVLVDPASYELRDPRCVTQARQAWVDGELVDVDQYVGRVTVVNLLDEPSRTYRAAWTFTYADGSTSSTSRSVFPLHPGESVEVGGLAGDSANRPSPPVSCEVQIEDSPLNHLGGD